MFYYITDNTTYPTLDDFRLAFKDTSFGDLNSAEYREQLGLVDCVDEPPAYDGKLQELVRGNAELVDGKYRVRYTTVLKDLPKEERIEIWCNRFEQALYDHYDQIARDKQYDNRDSVLKRAGYPNPFREEAEAFGMWVGICDEYSYRLMSEIRAGVRPLPHLPNHYIQQLPVMQWPERK